MDLNWSDELVIDVQEMDKQHETLVKKINVLVDALEADNFDVKLFDELAGFVVKHFEDEEAYMEKVGFPGLAGHKLIHKKLLSDVSGFREQIENKSVDKSKLNIFLAIWLKSHIKGIDKQYAVHAHEMGKAA